MQSDSGVRNSMQANAPTIFTLAMVASLAHSKLLTGVVRRLFRLLRRRICYAPISPLIPVFTNQFSRVLSTARTIPTIERIYRTIFVTPPANSLGVFWIEGEWFCHRFAGSSVNWVQLLLMGGRDGAPSQKLFSPMAFGYIASHRH